LVKRGPQTIGWIDFGILLLLSVKPINTLKSIITSYHIIEKLTEVVVGLLAILLLVSSLILLSFLAIKETLDI